MFKIFKKICIGIVFFIVNSLSLHSVIIKDITPLIYYLHNEKYRVELRTQLFAYPNSNKEPKYYIYKIYQPWFKLFNFPLLEKTKKITYDQEPSETQLLNDIKNRQAKYELSKKLKTKMRNVIKKLMYFNINCLFCLYIMNVDNIINYAKSYRKS